MIQRFLRQKNRFKLLIIGAILFLAGQAFTSAQSLTTINDYKIGVITTDSQGESRSVNVRGNITTNNSRGSFISATDPFRSNNGMSYAPISGTLTTSLNIYTSPSRAQVVGSMELCYGSYDWSYVVFTYPYSSPPIYGDSYVSRGSTLNSLPMCFYNPKNTVVFAMKNNNFDRYSPLPLYDGSGSDSTVFGMLSRDYGVFGKAAESLIVFPYPAKFSSPAIGSNFLPSFLSEDEKFFSFGANGSVISPEPYYWADLSTSFSNPTSASTVLLMWNVNSDTAFAILGPDGTTYFKGYVTDFRTTLDTGQAFADNRFLSRAFQGGQLQLSVMGLNVGGYTQVFSQNFAIVQDNSVVLPPPSSGGGGSNGSGDVGDFFLEGETWEQLFLRIRQAYPSIADEDCLIYNNWLTPNYSGGYPGVNGISSFTSKSLYLTNYPECSVGSGFNGNLCNVALHLRDYCYASAEIMKGNGKGLVGSNNIFTVIPDRDSGVNSSRYTSLNFGNLLTFWTEKFNEGRTFFGTFDSLTCHNGPMPGLGKKWDFVIFIVFLFVFIPFIKK